MSFNALSIVSSALSAFQAAENVVSNDITNVDTPGASEERPVLSSSQAITSSPSESMGVSPGTIGQGVSLTSITRLTDNALAALYRGAYSSQNYYTQVNTGLTNFQSSLNEPSAGISSALQNFETAVSQLASVNTNASNATANRASVLQSGQALVASLNSAGDAIQSQQTEALTNAASLVTSVNGLLKQIASLNGEIRAATAAGESPNTDLDQRDYDITQLSQYIPVTVQNETNGSTLVSLNGQSLVDDTIAYNLALPTIVNSSNGQTALVIASTANPGVPLTIGSGSIGGVLDLYNGNLATYAASLDGLSASIAQQFNNINQSGYDQNGQQGAAVFTSPAGTASITAADIEIGLSSASQIAMASASTDAGSLVQSMNASTTSIDTSSIINSTTVPNNGNIAFANPAPTGGLTGTIQVAVDGITKTLNYNTTSTDSTVGSFISNFNALQAGVTASFNSTSQSVVFTRDPSNESLAFQATSGYAPTASFTLTDTPSGGAVAAGQPASGTTAASLFQVLGAGAMTGVTQNGTNAYSTSDNTNAEQLQNIFTRYVGVPPASTTATGAIIAGTQTVTPVGGLGNIVVGSVLTIDSGTAQQENVNVTAINTTTVPQTFTAVFANPHLAGVTIQAAETQTLGSYYANFIATVGFSGSAAKSGLATQTNLTSTLKAQLSGETGINIDQETQNLIQYQMAYQAAAKTFSTLESMLTSLMQQI
jgi:flagellar hook-associated protein 1 FlgK